MIDRPSPNFDERRAAIDMLVLHYTGMANAADALARLCDPAERVSAHYLVDEDGTVYRLIGEDSRAWHAGLAYWRGARDINSLSIGIELANPGHDWGYRNFPAAQMAALESLARDIVARHGIAPARVLGHSDVAPRRKTDPGELFDWARLARAGIGLWPPPGTAPLDAPTFEPGARAPEVAEAQRCLAKIGYEIAETGTLDDMTAAVLRAFQRRFRQSRIDGALDSETVARLGEVEAVFARGSAKAPTSSHGRY